VTNVLKVNNVSKVFNKNNVNEKVALKNVNLELREGDFVTVIGSNGAGKSTLLNAVAGVFPVDSGTISLGQSEVTAHPEHIRAARIGRVFQDPLLGTAASMTIEENLVLALRRGQKRRLRRAVSGAERQLFREKLALLELGLENRLTTPVGLLSGGQRQALTLLMATLKEPELLLLDEHTAALDPVTAGTVLDLTCRLIERMGLTTLMVTHNLEQALNVGNRTVMMHEGQIVLNLMGEERRRAKISDLLRLFKEASGSNLYQDSMLLA